MRRQVAADFPILYSISLGVWADAAAEIDHLLGLIFSPPVPLRAQRRRIRHPGSQVPQWPTPGG